MASSGFTFEQIKLNANENVTNAVINRALIRLWKNIDNVKNAKGVTIPEASANEPTILVDYVDETTNAHVKAWQPLSTLHDFGGIANPKLINLLDMPGNPPVSGQTIVYGLNNTWEYKPFPTSISQFPGFGMLSSNPPEDSILVYKNESGWTPQVQSEFIGIGYIQHVVCKENSVVILPTDMSSLSGGEQVVITKLNKPGENIQVAVTTDNNSSTSANIAAAYYGLATDNISEVFSSIHLRACEYSDGNVMKFTWVPVAATGSWRPYTPEEKSKYEKGLRRQLESNELKLQPYNLDINFSLNGADVTKKFTVVLEKESNTGKWTIDSPETSTGVGFTINNDIVISHNILNGTTPITTTVYYYNGEKISQIIPDDIWMNVGEYGTTYVNISSWLPEADISSITKLKFEIVTSI